MSKKAVGLIKLQLPAGSANPAPPVGPALGAQGVNIMGFCKEFNAKTKDQAGMILPVEITVYADRSFTFILKSPPAAVLLKKAAGLAKGSGVPNRDKVGKVSKSQVLEIVKTKQKDLNANDEDAACRIIEGTARLLSVTGTKESSIHRLSSGDLVGACSFLQGISIEHVRAASDLKVLSLPDRKFLELLIKDSEFRNIFLSELFPAEVLQIAQLADSQDTANNFDLKDCFQKLGKLVFVGSSETFLSNESRRQYLTDKTLISLSKKDTSCVEIESLDGYFSHWKEKVSYLPPKFLYSRRAKV